MGFFTVKYLKNKLGVQIMMQLKKLFTPVSSLDADEAKAYMAGRREGDYTKLRSNE